VVSIISLIVVLFGVVLAVKGVVEGVNELWSTPSSFVFNFEDAKLLWRRAGSRAVVWIGPGLALMLIAWILTRIL
jgi:hypothetical protein